MLSRISSDTEIVIACCRLGFHVKRVSGGLFAFFTPFLGFSVGTYIVPHIYLFTIKMITRYINRFTVKCTTCEKRNYICVTFLIMKTVLYKYIFIFNNCSVSIKLNVKFIPQGVHLNMTAFIGCTGYTLLVIV